MSECGGYLKSHRVTILKILIALILLIPSLCFSSVTKSQAIQIYNRLIVANHILYPPKLIIVKSDENNAYRNGNVIGVYTGMLEFAKDANELAFVLGHELGHFVNHDNEGSYPAIEYRADWFGKMFGAKAGYDMCDGTKILSRFHDPADKTHPDSDSRYDRVKC